MNDFILTSDDVASLAKGQSIETKSSTIKKVAHYYTNASDISTTGIQLAEDIFRLMLQDIEVKVRSVLAESIKNSANLPRDIVTKIIADSETVSIPFIKFYNNPRTKF